MSYLKPQPVPPNTIAANSIAPAIEPMMIFVPLGPVDRQRTKNMHLSLVHFFMAPTCERFPHERTAWGTPEVKYSKNVTKNNCKHTDKPLEGFDFHTQFLVIFLNHKSAEAN